jgi:hypothetical protein
MTQLHLGSKSFTFEEWIDVDWAKGDFAITQADYLVALRALKLSADLHKSLSAIPWDTTEVRLNHWLTTEKGKYVGGWVKRYLKYIKTMGLSISNDQASVLGERITKITEALRIPLKLSFVRRADWKPGTYGEASNSCWFDRSGSYGWARDALLRNGGGALLIHDSEGEPRARCWWFPLHPKNLAIFNAYDKKATLALPGMARLLSTVAGVPYRMATDAFAGTAYVNGGNVYLLGDPLITRPVTLLFGYKSSNTAPVRSEADEEDEACASCGERVGPDFYITPNGDYICDDCYDNDYFTCFNCDNVAHNSDEYYIEHLERHVCTRCLEAEYTFCHRCDTYNISDDMRSQGSSDDEVCDSCYSDLSYCERCDTRFADDDDLHTVISGRGTEEMCESCRDRHAHYCDECGEYDVEEHNHEEDT